MTRLDHEVSSHPNLNRAIEEWAAENVLGGVVSGFAMVVAVASAADPNGTTYLYAFPDNQPTHAGLGLSVLLDRYLRSELDGDDEAS